MRVNQLLRRLDAAQLDEAGAAMAEYGLLLTGIAVVVGVAAFAFGQDLEAMFGTFLSLF